MSQTKVLDNYLKSSPSLQNVIDLFQDEWSSAMPSSSSLTSRPGGAALFEDVRIDWLEKVSGGFIDKDILELGPLEAGHSYMLQKGGARSVTAIEANTRAFLKCLCVKEVFDLSRVQFKLGDFNEFLDEPPRRYDMVVASGVLYHMTDPIGSLEKMARASDQLFIWTHYYDQQLIAHESLFEEPYSIPLAGFEGVGARRFYRDALEWNGFCGGSEPSAIWLSKATILEALKHFGFNKIETSFEHPDHPNGPAFALFASR